MTFDENFVENLNKNLKKRPFFEFYDYIEIILIVWWLLLMDLLML